MKRPFTKVVALELLESANGGLFRDSDFDLARLARECLKNLSNEDLKQMNIEGEE